MNWMSIAWDITTALLIILAIVNLVVIYPRSAAIWLVAAILILTVIGNLIRDESQAEPQSGIVGLALLWFFLVIYVVTIIRFHLFETRKPIVCTLIQTKPVYSRHILKSIGRSDLLEYDGVVFSVRRGKIIVDGDLTGMNVPKHLLEGVFFHVTDGVIEYDEVLWK